jgi:hypothetical protein
MALTESQLAMMSGYSKRSSQFGPSVRLLKSLGLAQSTAEGLALTEQGLDEANVQHSMPASPEALLAMWVSKLPKQAGVMLQTLASRPMRPDELADVTGYSMTSSQFGPSIRQLIKLGLIYEDRDADDKWLSIDTTLVEDR